ncbi:MAG: hypothetical protein WDW36_000232 [Sanguina aurantia]
MHVQVILVSQGMVMYEGPTIEMIPWFTQSLEYQYNPEFNGVPSDWVLDLVSVGFSKPKEVQEGSSMQSLEELQEAASHFAQMRKRQRHETLTTQPSLDSDDHHHTPLPGRPQRQQVRSQPQQPGPPLAHSPREIAAAANPVAAKRKARDDSKAAASGVEQLQGAASAASDQASDPGTPAPSQRGLAAAGMQDPQGQEVQPMTHQGVDSDHAGQAGPWMQITDPAAGPFSSASRRRTGLRHAIVKALYKGWMDYNSLVWREYLGLLRNPGDAAGRILTFVWVALVSNYITYSLPGDAAFIRVRMSLLFALLFFFLVMPFIFMSLFAADKRVYMLDAAAGLYHPFPYYMAKLSGTSPLNALIAVLFGWIAYGMLGNRHTIESVVYNTICCILMSLISMQWLHFSSTVTPNQDMAFILAVAFAVVNLLINTFFLGKADLQNVWIKGFRYISALDYAWQGTMVAEFKDRTFDCNSNTGLDALGFTPELAPTAGRFAFLQGGLSNPGPGCLAATNALLGYYNINTNIGAIIGYLVAYLVVLHIFTYLALINAGKRKRANI